MGTNSIIRFYFSNEKDIPFACLYRHCDSFPEEYLKDIADYLYKEDQKEQGMGRLNWNNLVTGLISYLYQNVSKKITLILPTIFTDTKNIDYIFNIIPDEKLYGNINLILSKTIKVKIDDKEEIILYDYLKQNNLNKIKKDIEY